MRSDHYELVLAAAVAEASSRQSLPRRPARTAPPRSASSERPVLPAIAAPKPSPKAAGEERGPAPRPSEPPATLPA